MTPPVTTIPARPSAWEPLEAALRQRRPLRLTYHGRQRLMSPHALSWNHGRPMLLAYQTPTPATTTAHADSPPGWRCMYIDEIHGIHSADPPQRLGHRRQLQPHPAVPRHRPRHHRHLT